MSFSIDTNILVYAVNEASPRHSAALDFLRRAATGTEVVALAWPALMGFLRISTHPSIFENPLSADEARDAVGALIALPNVRTIGEEQGFWDVYLDATRGVVVRGNLVPDAHLAAVLRQHGVKTLYSADSDFKKFAFLDVRNPFGS